MISTHSMSIISMVKNHPFDLGGIHRYLIYSTLDSAFLSKIEAKNIPAVSTI